jgi:2-(1,2-epoxy-1,2-dihydrophenyl)acetyl-CoA isomerase
MAMTEPLRIERDGPVARVILNRAAAFNALNMDLVTALADSFVTLAGDRGVRAIVLSGEGRAFCSGGDLKWVLACAQGPDAAFHQLAARFHLAITEIRRMAKPVVAALNGVAAGGGFSLALACDFRVMAESAVLRQAYTSSGLSIDGGGSFTLPRMVGLARALEIAAFDQPISSDQALSWGLATKVVKDGSALAEATAMAHDLAGRSLHSFGLSKQLLNDSFSSPLEAHLEREREALSRCGAHPDGLEGLRAFTEKRKPTFI